ncbi:hypothetical protein PVK06_025163 [Gossypium arboreum]|uniref:Aminotransferase-like plant mobile domain-containing protein n=1 Tax=Gossypium arboreum TaxID=29729 RepID=A0ABR0PFN8_GOSAR|nr:hypothetical protein PVK06_025163 [Gossypium arboreum]
MGRLIQGRVNGLGYSLDERLMPYLELVGFESTSLIRMFDLRYDLISALVERWRPKTYTFHLSCGECTVTPEDVSLQLGLPIDRSAVTGDANSNRVHLMYLPLLTNLLNVRLYSWGSAVLAILYRMTKHDVVNVGGCLLLLQSWALYRMPFLASVRHKPYAFPLVNSPVPLHYSTPPDPYPPHYSTPVGSYPPQYSTPPGSSLSMAFGAYDFSFMCRTPPPTTEEDVDHRDHPQYER